MEMKTAQEGNRDLTQATPNLETQICPWGSRDLNQAPPKAETDLRGFQILKICTKHPGSVDHGFCLKLAFGILEAHKAFLLISK